MRTPDKKRATPEVARVLPREKATEALRARAGQGRQLVSQARVSYDELKAWSLTARAVIVGAFGEPSTAAAEFDKSLDLSTPLAFYASEQERGEDRLNALKRAVDVLQSCMEQIDLGLGGAQAPERSAIPVDELAKQLGFVADHDLAGVVTRDLSELGRVTGVGGSKSSLLLCGSVLEAILVDVLDRNRAVAGSYMGRRKFPDDASLNDLIRIASDAKLIDDTRYLLSSTAAGMAGTITEHRDLIHPHAELRGRMRVDNATVEAMIHLLGLVVRDLAEAEARGDIAAYAAK